MPTLAERVRRGWNAFFNNRDPSYEEIGAVSSYRPDRIRLSYGNERSIVTALYNRIALDVSAVDIRHVRVDKNKRFIEEIESDMNSCFSLSANVDQTGRAMFQDAVMSMFDEGCVALVPTDTSENPRKTDSYDIYSIRTAKIIQWYPKDVMLRLYNENKGQREDITLPKSVVSIVENPFYTVMNEPNSTLKRLIRKLTLLDQIDEYNGAGKIDLIIQLPYIIKTPQRRAEAEKRRKEIEYQLTQSKYGIAYTDGTEHITQLNRSVDNQLLAQIKDLTELLYSQLGITQEIMNGSADEKTMLNYMNRVIEPILEAFCTEMKRKWLTKTARTQGQSIMYFRDPFRLVPLDHVAEMADKFTRNEILTSNEFRGIIGFKPSDDPNADQLRNKNLNQSVAEIAAQQPMAGEQTDIPEDDQITEDDYNSMMGELDALDEELDKLEKEAA